MASDIGATTGVTIGGRKFFQKGLAFSDAIDDERIRQARCELLEQALSWQDGDDQKPRKQYAVRLLYFWSYAEYSILVLRVDVKEIENSLNFFGADVEVKHGT